MSLTIIPKRRKRGLHNYPAPLDMTLLGMPGSPNPRRTIILSTARPSTKESVATPGLNYSLPSGSVPDLPAELSPPLPEVPYSLLSSSPNCALNTFCSSRYTATDSSAVFSDVLLSTTPQNLARLQALSLPTSPAPQEQVDGAVPPSPPPSDPSSPVTPPLLTPAPDRPARRWGMTVFPQNKVIRRTSSTPSSPGFVNNSLASPTSIIAIKSPVEWRDSRRISDSFSPTSPFTALLPQVMDVQCLPPTLTQTPPSPSIPPPTPPKHNSLPPAPFERNNLGTIKESDPPVKTREKQPRSPIVKTSRKSFFRGTSSHHKHISSTHRRESSVRGSSRRLMLKRDSGAPFAMTTAAAAEFTSPPAQVELAEMKEGQRNSRRWSASRRFLQPSARRSKATVVMMRRGKEKVEEKDIVAVIPQLRELKASKRLGL